MNLNNLTNKQLENKIKVRRLKISRDDTKAMEKVIEIIENISNEVLALRLIDDIVTNRLSSKDESLGYIDEITEVLENQIWMQNRNK